MNDRILVEVIHGSHDAVLEFLFGCDADVAQDGSSELGEEAFDQVQPGAVLGREGELEATRSGGEPCIRFFGDVGGMIVEDQADRGVRRTKRGIDTSASPDRVSPAARAGSTRWASAGPLATQQVRLKNAASVW